MILKTRAHRGGDVHPWKAQPSKKDWGQKWEANLIHYLYGHVHSPLAPVSSTHLSAENVQIMPHSEAGQDSGFSFLWHSCHQRLHCQILRHSCSHQNNQWGHRRPSLGSSHQLRELEFACPGPCEGEWKDARIPSIKDALTLRNVLEDLRADW